MKALAAILFAFLLLWPSPAAVAGAEDCGGAAARMDCAGCCCCAASKPAESSMPLAPVPSRPAASEQLVLLLPTLRAEFLALDRAAQVPPSDRGEPWAATGALPLFRRDCAWLI